LLPPCGWAHGTCTDRFRAQQDQRDPERGGEREVHDLQPAGGGQEHVQHARPDLGEQQDERDSRRQARRGRRERPDRVGKVASDQDRQDRVENAQALEEVRSLEARAFAHRVERVAEGGHRSRGRHHEHARNRQPENRA